MGNDVEGDLLGEELRRLGIGDVDRLGLLEELVHGGVAGARDGLIRRDHDAADAGGIVQGLQGHHHLDGRAVGIGDDVALAIAFHGFGVDLGHHQGHVRVHAEMRRVVDDHAAGLGGSRCMNGGDFAAGRKETDIPALEVEAAEVLHVEHVVLAERDLLAGRTLGRQRRYLVDGKLPLGEYIQKFPADVPRRTGHSHAISHFLCSVARLRAFGLAGTRPPAPPPNHPVMVPCGWLGGGAGGRAPCLRNPTPPTCPFL